MKPPHRCPKRLLVPSGLWMGAWLALGLGAAGLDAQPPTFVADTQPAGALRPPLPVWPSDGVTLTERAPIFRLNGRWGASQYRVELARDAQFTEPRMLAQFRVVEQSGIEPVVLVPLEGTPLEDGHYFWRAFCAGEEGEWTPPANYRIFEVAEDERDAMVLPGQLEHPRLLLGPGEMTAFRERLARSEHLQRGWQYMLNAALSQLDADPPDEAYARSGPGQHGHYNTAASWYHRHLGNIALVAWLSNNKRLASKGIELLTAACSYERWLGPLFDDSRFFDPPWHSALETAMMTEAVAVGYDLLYHELTEPQRERVRNALMEKGIRPLVREWADPIGASRLPRHQLPTDNWVMVCSAGAGVGALALLGEHPEAPEAVRLVRNRIRAWLSDRGGDWCADGTGPTPGHKPVVGPSQPNFAPDGGYKESITYMEYAMRHVAYFADPLRRFTGESLFAAFPPNLLEPVSWNVLAWPESGLIRSRLIDFGDCGPRADFSDLYAALMRNTGDRRAAWLYHHTVAFPRTARSLTWYDDTVTPSAPSAPLPMGAFPGIGQVVLRAGWSPEMPVAAIKFHQNRGHLDLGTFFLFGPGGPAIIDSGATGYGTAIYRDYSSRSLAHNVVLVDGQAQEPADGRLLAALATSRLAAASGQIAPAHPDALNAWTRDLIMLPGGDFIVFDQLSGKGPRQFDYILHPGPAFEIIGDRTIRLSSGARIDLASVLPLQAHLESGYYRSSPQSYARFETSRRGSQQAFALICRWPSSSSGTGRPISSQFARTQPALTDAGVLQSVPDVPGRWWLDRPPGRSELFVRLGGAADRIASDARVAIVHCPEIRKQSWHLLALDATRVTLDGRDLLRADRPVNIVIEADTAYAGTVEASEPTRILLPAEERFTHAFLSGEPIDTPRSRETISVSLPAGRHQLELSELSRPMPRMAPLLARDLLAVAVPADAPAFAPGVRVSTSTSASEGLAAIDGDPASAWSSLPGMPMPQWLLVSLPRPTRMNQIRLVPGRRCQGHVEVFDATKNGWDRRRRFAVLKDGSEALIPLPALNAQQIRVVIESVADGGQATLRTLEWAEAARTPELVETPDTQPERVRISVPLTTRQAESLRRALGTRPGAGTQPSSP